MYHHAIVVLIHAKRAMAKAPSRQIADGVVEIVAELLPPFPRRQLRLNPAVVQMIVRPMVLDSARQRHGPVVKEARPAVHDVRQAQHLGRHRRVREDLCEIYTVELGQPVVALLEHDLVAALLVVARELHAHEIREAVALPADEVGVDDGDAHLSPSFIRALLGAGVPSHRPAACPRRA